MIFDKGFSNIDSHMIKRYLPKMPTYSHRKVNSIKKIDYVYILLCSLILTGFAQTVESNIARIMPKTPTVASAVLAYEGKAVPTPIIKLLPVKNDNRATRLETFLKSKNSPFAYLASYIVQQSDENGIDWTLIVGISKIESDYGTSPNMKQKCNNPFGLGGDSVMCFDSWDKAIAFEAKLLGEDYRYNATRGIQQKYCPDSDHCNPAWAQTVVNTSQEILAMDVK